MLLPILFVAFLASLASVHGSTLQMFQMDVGCGFHLTATGGFNGSVGQLPTGLVRAGSDLSPTLFTWFGDAFADQLGRGCWWTRMTPKPVTTRTLLIRRLECQLPRPYFSATGISSRATGSELGATAVYRTATSRRSTPAGREMVMR